MLALFYPYLMGEGSERSDDLLQPTQVLLFYIFLVLARLLSNVLVSDWGQVATVVERQVREFVIGVCYAVMRTLTKAKATN